MSLGKQEKFSCFYKNIKRKEMQNNDAIKKAFVLILKSLGTGIKDVEVKIEKAKVSYK